MRSLEELREFFSHDRYATATTGIEILDAQDGYAKVGLAVHEGHMNFAFAVASNPDAGNAPITFTLTSQINFLTPARGRYLTAEARAVRKGRKASFYEAEIRDELDTLIAARSGRAERQAFMKQRSGMNWIL